MTDVPRARGKPRAGHSSHPKALGTQGCALVTHLVQWIAANAEEECSAASEQRRSACELWIGPSRSSR